MNTSSFSDAYIYLVGKLGSSSVIESKGMLNLSDGNS